MKKIMMTIIICTACLNLFALSETVSKNITAYKYSSYENDPLVELRITNANGTDSSTITIGNSALVQDFILCSWKCIGNTPGQLSLEISASPLALQNSSIDEWLTYDMTITPQPTSIGGSSLSTQEIGPYPHQSGNTTYKYYYSESVLAPVVINQDTRAGGSNTFENSTKSITIPYTLTTRTNPAGYTVTTVDHWIRQGTVAIKLDTIPEGTSFGTYSGNLTFHITGGA